MSQNMQVDTIVDTVFVLQQTPQFDGSALALLWLNVGALVAVAISAGLLYQQIKKAHKWNRLKSAHDLNFEASQGAFRALRDRFERKISIYDEKQTYSNDKAKLSDEDHEVLDTILNFFENICIAIKNHVIDGDMVFDSLDGVLLAYMRWATPYIEAERKRIDSPRLWIEMDPIIKDWTKRREKMRKKIDDAVKTTGHRPL